MAFSIEKIPSITSFWSLFHWNALQLKISIRDWDPSLHAAVASSPYSIPLPTEYWSWFLRKAFTIRKIVPLNASLTLPVIVDFTAKGRNVHAAIVTV